MYRAFMVLPDFIRSLSTVGGNIPVVSKWIPHGGSAFCILHLHRLVQRLRAIFESPSMGLIYVRNVDMNRARHRSPFLCRLRQLDGGITDSDGSAGELPVRLLGSVDHSRVINRHQKIQQFLGSMNVKYGGTPLNPSGTEGSANSRSLIG